MKLSLCAISPSYVKTVLLNACQVHAQEIARSSDTIEQAAQVIGAHIKAGSGDGVIGLVDETPVALFFHWKQTEIRRGIMFIATKQLFDIGARGAIACRHHLKELTLKNPGIVYRAVNRAQHPKMDRWLELLGFRDEGIEGDARIFTLGRN